ncbi:MAG: RNA pseudouridine synthase [Bdellovibrionaceae bacterium]|nr:RNA pseudouridine synthase [Pseudobdellovibrionaceae bacterium]|tara:strand:- start:447 stop:1106 length:660 start_codon:yes stop_codon:yes gene_type:complete
MNKQRFDIYFEDNHLLVINKPSGLLSQGGPQGEDHLVAQLQEYLGRPYVGLVHRLDRNVSGIMVVAKRTKAAKRLTEALQSGKLCRHYLAWVHGVIETPIEWIDFLLKDSQKNKTTVVPKGTPESKKAILRGKPIKTKSIFGTQWTLLEIELETGRSHQIRVQLQHHGHPLLGDPKYGKSNFPFHRPALHSHWIEFPHPKTQKRISFKSPLPDEISFHS